MARRMGPRYIGSSKSERVMDQGTYILAGMVGLGALMVAVLCLMWALTRDVRGLSERVARLEGLLEGLLHGNSAPAPGK